MVKIHNTKSLVLFAAHPYDLVFYLRLVRESKIKKEYSLRVVLQEHAYFLNKSQVIEKILDEISSDVIRIKKSEIPEYGLNIIKNLIRAARFKRNISEAVKEESVAMVLDKSTYKSNIILSIFQKAILIQFPNKAKFGDIYVPSLKKNLLIKLYNMALGLHSVKVWRLKGAEKLTEEYLINSPTTKKVYISHGNNLDSMNFSSSAIDRPAKKILIFGSRYLGWNLEKEAVRKIYILYRNIYSEFKDHFKFIYIPHPLERGLEFNQLNKIFESNIKLETSYLNSEHFLLENPDIAHCFSIGSTSSKSAYQMGFNSKVAYKSILAGTKIINAFDRVFEDVPDCIHINYDSFEGVRKKIELLSTEAEFDKLYEVLQ